MKMISSRDSSQCLEIEKRKEAKKINNNNRIHLVLEDFQIWVWVDSEILEIWGTLETWEEECLNNKMISLVEINLEWAALEIWVECKE